MNLEEVKAKSLQEVNNKSLPEIIQEIADEEGMTYAQTMKLFKSGLKESHAVAKKKNSKDKAKDKKKRKQSKVSRKKNQ